MHGEMSQKTEGWLDGWMGDEERKTGRESECHSEVQLAKFRAISAE